MKKQTKTNIIKLSERFDKQLFTILSKELDALKSAQDLIIKKLQPKPEDGVMVA